MEISLKGILSDDHREVDEILQQLLAAFERSDVSEVQRRLDYFWARLAMHIRSENLHIFPAVLRNIRDRAENEGLESIAMEAAIAQLNNDHNFFMRELGAGVKELFDLGKVSEAEQNKRLTALCSRVEAVRDRLEQHNEIEESGIYLWCETLEDIEKESLRSKVRHELDNLPPRFAKAD
jgi:hemerythrin-like domain-containing protein